MAAAHAYVEASVPNPKSVAKFGGVSTTLAALLLLGISANYSSASRLASAAEPPPTLATDFGSGTLAGKGGQR